MTDNATMGRCPSYSWAALLVLAALLALLALLTPTPADDLPAVCDFSHPATMPARCYDSGG